MLVLLRPSAPPRLVTACSTRMSHQPNLTHCAPRSWAERAAARAAMHSWAACPGPCKNTGPCKNQCPAASRDSAAKIGTRVTITATLARRAHRWGPTRTPRRNPARGSPRPYILAAQGLCSDLPHKDSPPCLAPWHASAQPGGAIRAR